MDVRGTWTQQKIVYAVFNNLEAGMKTTVNYNFPIEQLYHQIVSERNALIKQVFSQGMMDESDKADLMQEINCIELDCNDLGLCCSKSTQQNVLHFTIPQYNYLDYIGLATQDQPFKVYTNIGSKYDKYRDSRLGKRTHVQFRNKEGVIHGFVFNPPTPNLKYVSVRAIFDNPNEVNQYACCNYNPEEHRFPVPDYMVEQIINSLTSKYASYFYRFQGQRFPNTQNSIG